MHKISTKDFIQEILIKCEVVDNNINQIAEVEEIVVVEIEGLEEIVEEVEWMDHDL